MVVYLIGFILEQFKITKLSRERNRKKLTSSGFTAIYKDVTKAGQVIES
jgi:hypothetical protein